VNFETVRGLTWDWWFAFFVLVPFTLFVAYQAVMLVWEPFHSRRRHSG
jgi:Mg2+ and Co2+ transporter CorA